jgi:hypothetical protein
MDLIEKLRVVGALKLGDDWPSFLSSTPNGWDWGPPLSEMCREAADEITRLRRAQTNYHPWPWEPIETAPVPPREELGGGRWRCLLQHKSGFVVSGFASYVQRRGRRNGYDIQWYDEGYHVFHAKYWMPLPLPRKDEP